MLQNYEQEIKALESNTSLDNKLMIISLYNEFFNYLIAEMSYYYHDRFEKLMHETFIQIVSSNEVTNVDDFCKRFLSIINNNKLSEIGNVRKIINDFSNTLEDYVEGMDYVETIDSFHKISFPDKVKLLVLFRNQINSVLLVLQQTFGRESEEIRIIANGLIDFLINDTDDYLALCDFYDFPIDDTIKSYSDALKSGTKMMLFKKFSNGEFSFALMQNDDLRNYFESFKPLEQNILLLGMIYGISGYTNEECDNERQKEICELLGISKIKYQLILTKLSIRKVALIRKNEKEKQKMKVKED